MNVVQSIADTADELCDGRQHVERIAYWDSNRNRKHRQWVTIQRGLLAQLYESVIPSGGSDEGRRTVPASRPPLALEALSTHTVITLAAAQWCWSLRLEQRETVEGNIRALVGAAPTLDSDTAHRLRTDLRRWRNWCAVMTGWEVVQRFPNVPCICCGELGTLRVNLTTQAGFCTNQARTPEGEMACGATWDAATIGLLADYIRTTEGTAA